MAARVTAGRIPAGKSHSRHDIRTWSDQAASHTTPARSTTSRGGELSAAVVKNPQWGDDRFITHRKAAPSMITIRNILVAVDFNDGARPVLDFGRTLADACGASLHLVHVLGQRVAGPEVSVEERQGVCRRLQALLGEEDRERRHVTTSCEVGTPAPEIARYAADNDVDLIIMGTHSHAPTFRMATGSVAEAVLGLAPCAVLAVKGVKQSSREVPAGSVPAATAAN
jgi:nucleotide-binding universal stress UspA family protein